MSVNDMYKISTRAKPWGIEGYEIPKDYLDHKKLADIRENKKQPPPKATKRGSYMDDATRLKKFVPGPDHYNLNQSVKEEKSKPSKSVANRATYIDEILTNGKKRPTPGPNAYNIIKTEKQIQDEVEKLRRKSKRDER